MTDQTKENIAKLAHEAFAADTIFDKLDQAAWLYLDQHGTGPVAELLLDYSEALRVLHESVANLCHIDAGNGGVKLVQYDIDGQPKETQSEGDGL